ncbi:MAG: SRPBCC domain-containing protein [Rhodobiaceae bacterium]|nr:SRPBCC domain-containing protein [Rhodobiaceae bacterium]
MTDAAPAGAATAPSLRIERTFAASPEDVFDAWTKPDIMRSWWGPEAMTPVSCEADLREGGRWRVEMRGSETSYAVGGQYVRIDRPRELVFTWSWEGGVQGADETLVTVTMATDGDNTVLVLLHERFATAVSRDNHHRGWTSTLNSLEKHFS